MPVKMRDDDKPMTSRLKRGVLIADPHIPTTRVPIGRLEQEI